MKRLFVLLPLYLFFNNAIAMETEVSTNFFHIVYYIQKNDILGGGYAKDSWRVYYRGKVVKDASASSFKYLGGGYAKDNWTVFYRGIPLKGATASSFTVMKDGYAKDNWNTYYRGSVIKD